MLGLVQMIHDAIHQYPVWSLWILLGVAVFMGIFTLRQLLQSWQHFQNKRQVLRKIRQYFSQNKNPKP